MTALPKNYDSMTPEQRKLYDETVAKNKVFDNTLKAMRERIKATQKQMQENYERAQEEYRKGQQTHIENSIKASNKFGKVNLGERKCPICGKTFFVKDKTAWIFKVRYGKGFAYLCSESCKEQRAKKKVKRGKK